MVGDGRNNHDNPKISSLRELATAVDHQITM